MCPLIEKDIGTQPNSNYRFFQKTRILSADSLSQPFNFSTHHNVENKMSGFSISNSTIPHGGSTTLYSLSIIEESIYRMAGKNLPCLRCMFLLPCGVHPHVREKKHATETQNNFSYGRLLSSQIKPHLVSHLLKLI